MMMSGRLLGNAFVAIVASSALALGVVALKASPMPAIPGPTGATPSSIAIAEHSYYDNQFLTALGGEVTSVNRSIAIGMGHRTCSAFTEGVSAADIRGVLVQKGLAPEEASRVVLAAVSTFCPDHKDKAMG
jgi:hypothetical protein